MIEPVAIEHSADVTIRLWADGHEFDVAKLRWDRCIVRNPIELAPCDATLAVTIDGQQTTEEVYLRDGVRSGDPCVWLL